MAKRITRDDLIRVGACADGVSEWAEKFAKNLTAIPALRALELCEKNDSGAYFFILKAADLTGYGDGDGYG